MKQILFSIIIPVYNCESNIDKCLESVVNQSYKNIEILLVDDGSSDNSKIKCEIWQKKDKRINFISNEKNMGSAYSRNVGIEVANGDYLSFIDIDDYIELDMYAKLAKVINDNKEPDIVKFQYIKELGKYKKVSSNSQYGMIECGKDKNVYLDMFFKKHDFAQVWNAVFKKISVNQLRFKQEYKNSQDYFYFLNALFEINSMIVIKDVLYHWVINEKSVTHSVDIDKCLYRLNLHYEIDKEVYDLVIEKGYINYEKDLLNASISIGKILLSQYAGEIKYKDYNRIINDFTNGDYYKEFYDRAKGKIDLRPFERILFKYKKINYAKYRVKSRLKKIIKKLLKMDRKNI